MSRVMKRFRISLSTLVIAVALMAVNCALIRWGLGLPNLMANDLIQEIVIGGAPMASLLGLGAVVAVHDRVQRGACRPFWIGFLAGGSIALVAYVSHAYFVCQPGRHYATDYEMAMNFVLSRIGLRWGPRSPGGDALRSGIVITSLALLLAAPQVLSAVFGGWIMQQSRRGRRMARAVS